MVVDVEFLQLLVGLKVHWRSTDDRLRTPHQDVRVVLRNEDVARPVK